MKRSLTIFVIALAIIIGGVFLIMKSPALRPKTAITPNSTDSHSPAADLESQKQSVDFGQFNDRFQFSAELPANWLAKYVTASESIAIYPTEEEAKDLNNAAIFIRHFQANNFLTLSTVNILNREQTKVGTHSAVKYEIEKKAATALFANQPLWRSARHKLIDIRYNPSGSTTFFVVAFQPSLDRQIFDTFIQSLSFYNDKTSVKAPLDKKLERVIKKSFKTLVSPTESPVSPERFSGYHTGWDFEVFPEELNKNVTVNAFCGGKLRLKETATGYGGVAVQECSIDGVTMTVIYGHLKLTSVTANVGDYLTPSAKIGLLGADQSSETDGERKHLHFGLHQGPTTNISGYVNSLSELSAWIDPKVYL